MLENGLVEEAKAVYKHRHCNALNTVGYKELFQYFDGLWTLDFAISEIKKNSRRFAKRQMTWFQKDTKTKWFEYDTDVQNILEYINTSDQNRTWNEFRVNKPDSRSLQKITTLLHKTAFYYTAVFILNPLLDIWLNW